MLAVGVVHKRVVTCHVVESFLLRHFELLLLRLLLLSLQIIRQHSTSLHCPVNFRHVPQGIGEHGTIMRVLLDNLLPLLESLLG